jgi:hypothetical protein
MTPVLVHPKSDPQRIFWFRIARNLIGSNVSEPHLTLSSGNSLGNINCSPTVINSLSDICDNASRRAGIEVAFVERSVDFAGIVASIGKRPYRPTPVKITSDRIVHQVTLPIHTPYMSPRVSEFDWVISNIREPVERLRIPRRRDYRVRLHEPSQGRVVVSGVVKVQPNCSIFNLPCKAAVGGRGAGGVARLAVGVVAQFTDLGRAVAVRRDGSGP